MKILEDAMDIEKYDWEEGISKLPELICRSSRYNILLAADKECLDIFKEHTCKESDDPLMNFGERIKGNLNRGIFDDYVWIGNKKKDGVLIIKNLPSDFRSILILDCNHLDGSEVYLNTSTNTC